MKQQSKGQFQKVPIEIIGIGKTNNRVVEIIMKDGGKASIRRDLLEVYGNRAFVPKWLGDKIMRRCD